MACNLIPEKDIPAEGPVQLDLFTDYGELQRREEARKYAELLPEGDTRDNFLGLTMTGEEQVQHGQKRLWKAMWTLLMRLVEDTPDSVRIEACEAAETIVRLLIPDGNFLDAYDLLYLEKVVYRG